MKGQNIMLYNYTYWTIQEYPRSRSLAEIDGHNLPFANQGNLISSKSIGFAAKERHTDVVAKDTKDLTSLTKHLAQPLNLQRIH